MQEVKQIFEGWGEVMSCHCFWLGTVIPHGSVHSSVFFFCFFLEVLVGGQNEGGITVI